MRWTTFPAFLGGRLEGTFTVRPGQHVMTSIQVRLRCVRDEWTERRTQDGRTSALEPYVIYEQSFELLPPGETLDELPLTFDLPADLPGTDLGRNERPPTGRWPCASPSPARTSRRCSWRPCTRGRSEP